MSPDSRTVEGSIPTQGAFLLALLCFTDGVEGATQRLLAVGGDFRAVAAAKTTNDISAGLNGFKTK